LKKAKTDLQEMNLKEAILKEYSRKQCDLIVKWIGNRPERFDELFRLFLKGGYRVTQRAAWPLSYTVIAHPEFMTKNLPLLVKHLQKPGLHDAVKRNGLRILQSVSIPEKYEGNIMKICFDFLDAPGEPVAIKAFSLKLLARLSKKYPAIIPEIRLIVLHQLPNQTAAFRSSARPFLAD
jgi:hypothetical protein